jgi:hypothetical protein
MTRPGYGRYPQPRPPAVPRPSSASSGDPRLLDIGEIGPSIGEARPASTPSEAVRLPRPSGPRRVTSIDGPRPVTSIYGPRRITSIDGPRLVTSIYLPCVPKTIYIPRARKTIYLPRARKIDLVPTRRGAGAHHDPRPSPFSKADDAGQTIAVNDRLAGRGWFGWWPQLRFPRLPVFLGAI